MTPLTSVDGTGTSAAEHFMAMDQSELPAIPSVTSQPNQGTETIEPQEKSARLKLHLPKATQKSAITPVGLRRSLRMSERLADHSDTLSFGEATLPKKKTTEKKSPRFTLLSSLTTVQALGEAKNLPIEHAKPENYLKTRNPNTKSRRGSISPKINTGNVDEPIDVDALPSPPLPHKFVNRPVSFHGPLPPQYRSSRLHTRPTLLTPNGARILAGKVSGHQSHDIYKSYINKRDAPAPPGFTDICAKLNAEITAQKIPSKRFAPDGGMHPAYTSRGIGTNDQMYAQPLQMPYQMYPHNHRAHPHPHLAPMQGYPMYPVLNEEHLRKRAVQFVLEQSRPGPRKPRLSDDLDATSDSEYDDNGQPQKKRPKICCRPTTPAQQSDEVTLSSPSTGVSEDDVYDRNQKLGELVEHTQLLTALLLNYARSRDQKGLREDIAMLATVTDKGFANWVSAENAFDLDTRKRLSLAKACLPSDGGLAVETDARSTSIAAIATEAAEAQKERQDEEVRRYLYGTSRTAEDGDLNGPAVQDPHSPV